MLEVALLFPNYRSVTGSKMWRVDEERVLSTKITSYVAHSIVSVCDAFVFHMSRLQQHFMVFMCL